MENWQYELDKARSEGEREGFKRGVTKGYNHGIEDAMKRNAVELFTVAAQIGYLSHGHDLLDVLTEMNLPPGVASAIIEKLEPIEQVRIQTKSFSYGQK